MHELKLKFPCLVENAEHSHGNRDGCVEGTRSTILEEINLWAGDPGHPYVYWLNGLAGTGKTAIAQTVVERMFADGRLGASFFCSKESEDRRNPKHILPTLAFQLARKHARFRQRFLCSRPSSGDLREALEQLVEPTTSGVPTLIVIDALDECEDEKTVLAILSALKKFVSKSPKVKFLITSRPETHIRRAFRGFPSSVTRSLHEVDPGEVNDDTQWKIGRTGTHRNDR